MQNPIDYAFERACNEQLQSLTETLVGGQTGGGAEDYARYQFLCGQIYGIRFAMDALNRMRENYNPDGDVDVMEPVR